MRFDLVFDSNKMVYQAIVLYEIESVNIQYEKDDSKSSVEIIGNKNLKVGKNTITISVTHQG